MTPERLKEVEKIYHAVLEVLPQERDSYLKESCGNDSELRREIESLLAYENDFDSLIDAAPKSLAEEIFSQNKDLNFNGKQINQYKIERKIGEGGMGAVYLAKDSKLERRVAVKLLSNEFAQDSTRRNRFFQEAKSASALNHPNILTVHEIGEFEGTHFIVTEFIKGRTLSQYLAEERPTLQSVLEIATQIASALSAAHEAGIIHRDIKPDNVMVRNDGILKVLDFGIAKLMDAVKPDEIESEAETRAKPETQPGMIIGTPQYMSPEQARGQKIDLRSDIFSFGVLLYEMIAGKPPFEGITKMDIIGSILKDEPKSLREYQPEIPQTLEHIIQKTLRKDREQRYQHIKDLLIDLNDIKKTLEFDTKLVVHQTDIAKAATTMNTTSGIVMQRRFSLVHLVGFLLFAILSFGVIWWFFFRNNLQNISNLKTEEVVNWTSSPGEVYSVGTFSPEGKMIAFTSTKVGTKNIWVKQVSSGEAIQITKDDSSNEDPIWSPNGDELAYFSRKNQEAAFWRIPALGGSPKLIGKVENFNSRLLLWSKTNQIYYESGGEIFVVDSVSGQTKQVTQLVNQGIKSRSFGVSSDEKNIAFISEGEEKALWLTNLAGETPKKLFTSPTEIKNTAWHPDNRRLFYSAVVDGTFQVFVTDIYGAAPRQLTSSEQDSLVLDVSSDGGKILYGSSKEESDVWGFNLKESKEFTVASDINSELWADVSPDGKTVAYQSIKNLSQANRLFRGNILIKNLAAGEQPTEIVKEGGLPKWSPDGKTIVFIRISNSIHNLVTVKTQSGEEKPLTTNGFISSSYSVLPYNRVNASDFTWSPDSSKIVYVARQNEKHNLWLINADGSNNIQLTDTADSKANLSCPLWSNDGKKIAYSVRGTDSEGKAVFSVKIVDTETKKDDPIISGKSFYLIGWSSSGNELILASVEKNSSAAMPMEVTLQSVEVATGKLKQIQTLKDAYVYNTRLSLDKKMIAYTSHQEGKDNLWLMPATGGEPKKMTANNDSRLYFSSLAWSPDSNSIFYGKQLRYSLLSMLTNFQ